MYHAPIRSKTKHAEHLHVPPPAAARADFAPEFGRRFVVFVDTEEEFDWGAPFDRKSTGVGHIAAVPEANRRFVERGVAPTYLVDFPVADDQASADALGAIAAAGECDIGAHLHPWVTPPHEEEVSAANSFVGSLPARLERAKLLALTAKIEEAFGTRPVAYRAGRYGVGANTAAILAEAGYRLDVSVRALFDYREQGGPDFTDFPIAPYWLRDDLLEVPLTACLAGPLRRRPGLTRFGRLRGPLARSGLLNRIPLTPEGVPPDEAKAAVEALLERGTRLFSLSFHSPSLVPGHTPYVRDRTDLDRFWAWWDGVFDLFARHGVEPVRPGQIVAAAKEC